MTTNHTSPGPDGADFSNATPENTGAGLALLGRTLRERLVAA